MQVSACESAQGPRTVWLEAELPWLTLDGLNSLVESWARRITRGVRGTPIGLAEHVFGAEFTVSAHVRLVSPCNLYVSRQHASVSTAQATQPAFGPANT